MVDHKIAHKGDTRLFWDRRNWQPMNKRCNSIKAARYEGGFGREAKPYDGRRLGPRQIAADGWPVE